MIVESELRQRFPTIDWDEPVKIKVMSRPYGRWVCRYCIAMHGLKAAEIYHVPFAYDTRLQAQAHVREKHHG